MGWHTYPIIGRMRKYFHCLYAPRSHCLLEDDFRSSGSRFRKIVATTFRISQIAHNRETFRDSPYLVWIFRNFRGTFQIFGNIMFCSTFSGKSGNNIKIFNKSETSQKSYSFPIRFQKIRKTHWNFENIRKCRQRVGKVSAKCQRSVGEVSAKCRQSVGKVSARLRRSENCKKKLKFSGNQKTSRYF